MSGYMLLDYMYFLHMARKVNTVGPAGEKQLSHFTLLVEKISICSTGVSKECLRSHIIVARAAGEALPSAWATIIWDLRHSLLLLPRCIMYYFEL